MHVCEIKFSVCCAVVEVSNLGAWAVFWRTTSARNKLNGLSFTQRGPRSAKYPWEGHHKVKFSKFLICLSKKKKKKRNFEFYSFVTTGGDLRHTEQIIRLEFALETGAKTCEVCLQEGICIQARSFHSSSLYSVVGSGTSR